MKARMFQTAALAVSCIGLLAGSGCSECGGEKVASASCTTTKKETCARPAGEIAADLPPKARPGECWARVWVAPQFKTVSERVVVKEATEQLEIIPAKYEWVEERVCVKDSSKRLIEVPAEFSESEIKVKTEDAHTDWEVTNSDLCRLPDDQKNKLDGDKKMTKSVFCLVDYPAQHETIQRKCQVRPPQVREEIIPAQYETVRREKLVSPATTRKVCIPAEYETINKSVKVCDGRFAWQRVVCEIDGSMKVSSNRPIRMDRDFDRD
jgi:hypothetical protein